MTRACTGTSDTLAAQSVSPALGPRASYWNVPDSGLVTEPFRQVAPSTEVAQDVQAFCFHAPASQTCCVSAPSHRLWPGAHAPALGAQSATPLVTTQTS